MIRTGLPAAGVIENSLRWDVTRFEVLIVGADDLGVKMVRIKDGVSFEKLK